MDITWKCHSKHLHQMHGKIYDKDTCADPESFVRGGPTLTTFFSLVYEERAYPDTTISGPSPAHQRNAIKWCFAGVPMMARHRMLAW